MTDFLSRARGALMGLAVGALTARPSGRLPGEE